MRNLNGIVGQLIEPTPENKPVRIKGFDTTDRVSKSQAEAMKRDGYQFCVRYISLTSPADDEDLTYDEAQDILDGGLALMACQHVPNPGFQPTEYWGRARGEVARINAKNCGFPPGVNIWLDLEGIGEDFQDNDSDTIAYCNAWFDTVAQWGYVPGVYIGYDTWLTGSQLFHHLKFRHYWKAPGNIPEIEIRGYQIFQAYTVDEHGKVVDGLLDGKIYDNKIHEFKEPKQLVHGLDIDDDVAFLDQLLEGNFLIKSNNGDIV